LLEERPVQLQRFAHEVSDDFRLDPMDRVQEKRPRRVLTDILAQALERSPPEGALMKSIV